MKKRTLILVLIFQTLIGSCFSQPNDKISNEKLWIVKFAPLNIIDPVNPSLQIGLERQISFKNSFQFEFGYISPHKLKFSREIPPNYKGFKLRGEYRYKPFNKRQNIYIAGELYFTKNNYQAREGFVKSTDTIHYRPSYYEDIKINKKLLGLNLKIGYQKQVNHLIFEAYIGVGLKYKNIKHFNRTYPEDKIGTAIDFTIGDMTAGRGSDEKGNWLIPSFPINIKIGYVL